MRLPLATLACLLLLAGCASPAVDPDATKTGGSTDTSYQGGTGLGQLYLHNDGQRRWMDSQASSDDVDTPLVSVPGTPGLAMFTLEPTPPGAIATNGVAVVHLESSSPVAVQETELRVRFLLGAQDIATSYGRGLSQEHTLAIPLEIAAGSKISIDVCLCNATAGSFMLETTAASVFIGGPGAPGPGGAGGAPGNLTRGDVTVRQQGNQWVAERTDTAAVPVVAGKATVRMVTVNGAVDQHTGSEGRFAAHLRGRGDTEAEARDQLSRIYVHLVIGTEGGLSLQAEGRTTETGGSAWNKKEAGLELTLPSSVTMASAHLETVNGAVDSAGFAVDKLTTVTTNGALTASGTFSSWTAQATNGAISGEAGTPPASGTFSLQTTNGPVDLVLGQSSETGVDATARTTNGEATLDFPGAQPQGSQSRTSKHVQTSGYDAKNVQTVVALESTNGSVSGSAK